MDVGFELVASDVLLQVGCEDFDGVFEGEEYDIAFGIDVRAESVGHIVTFGCGFAVSDV